jgi:spore maturation protein B
LENISYYFIVGFILLILVFGVVKKTNVYDSFIDGAVYQMKEGISIFPYLLCMLVAVNVFKASGILNDLIRMNHIPKELFIQGAFRPASSHASMSIMLQIFKEYGVDSKAGRASAILQGGSDTTVYVMGLYFGSIGIKKTRHAYVVGLISDCVCFLCCVVLFLYFLND